MLSEALGYAQRGWAVFPCKSKDKVPATRHGFKNATKAPGAVREFWAKRPDLNVAIATGDVSGLVVVDVDSRHAGDETLSALTIAHGALPNVPTVETGDGVHLYFAHPGGHVKSRANALGQGVDVRADGGYVIAPPSVHPNGPVYRWRVSPNDVDLALPPAWLLDRLTQQPQQTADIAELSVFDVLSVSTALSVSAVSTPLDVAIEATLPTAPGQRNRKVFDLARLLRSHPATMGATLQELRPNVYEWHHRGMRNMSGNHGPDETWADFCAAWRKVRYTLDEGPLAEAMGVADAKDTPQGCPPEYAELARRLVKLCRELQGRNGDAPFFLACRSVAPLLGVSHTTANRLLQMLCVDGVLDPIFKGHTGRAAEYRYLPKG